MSDFVTIRQYKFLKFNPKLLYVAVVPTEHHNEAKPIGYKKILEQFKDLNLQAAVNGPMAGWSKDPKEPRGSYDTAQSMFLESAYYQKSTNTNFTVSKVGLHGGSTISVKKELDGTSTAHFSLGWHVPEEATELAIQFPITLVVNGKKADGLTVGNLTERNHRPAVGVTKHGNIILGGGFGSCEELAQALIDAGCESAGYTDGGGSYHFMFDNKLYGPEKDRPTPSWVLVMGDETTKQLLQENYK